MAREQIRKGSTELLILGLLHEGPLHGYGIRARVASRSRRRLELRDGMLYPVLKSLEERALISGEWVGAEGGRRKRVYSMTPDGEEYLHLQLLEWVRFMAQLEAVVPLLAEARELGKEYERK